MRYEPINIADVVKTKQIFTTKDAVKANNAKLPSYQRRAVNFAKAAYAHAKSGFRKATDEQVALRFSICEQCKLFKRKDIDRGRCLHPSCGCALKAVGVKGLNKLRWADQACPLKLWDSV